MIENKTTSDCTIYAFVGTAILAISLVVAMYCLLYTSDAADE